MTRSLNVRRLLAHLALGLLLLFAQHHATRHWLSHAVEATHAKEQGGPAGEHCIDCDALVAFGAALPTPQAVVPIPIEFEPIRLPTLHPALLLAAASVAYLSRAPPNLR